MKKKQIIQAELIVFGSLDELEDSERALCVQATEALSTSYARYSGYRVGAAVMMENGKMVKGSNQENAVYPLGICAERVAIVSAVSQFPDEAIVAIAVTTEKTLRDSDVPAFPCGSCRQTLVEMESRFKRDIPIYIFNSKGVVYKVNTVNDILPFAFDYKHLH